MTQVADDIDREPTAAAVPEALFGWHGAKWSMRHWIHAQLPAHRTLVEPFGGSGVLCATSTARFRLHNDLDGRLARVFTALMDPDIRAEAGALLAVIPRSELVTRDLLDRWHRRPETLTDAQALWAVVYLTVTTFSRSGPSTRRTSWSLGRSMRHRVPGADLLEAWAAVWRGVVVSCCDGVELIRKCADNPRSVLGGSYHDTSLPFCLYVDPPYHPEGSRCGGASGTRYQEYKHELDAAGHEQLVDALLYAAKAPHIRIALSDYHDSPTIAALAGGGDGGW
jgi:DNA adenine methylase